MKAASRGLAEGALFENAPCGYIVTALDGKIVQANETFREWLGWAKGEQLPEKRFAELVPRGARILYELHYLPVLEMQGHFAEVALDLQLPGGRRFPVLVNAKRLQREQHCLMVLFPAGKRRKYEQELLQAEQHVREALAEVERANRAKADFLANMSHEIRTPMNAVLGFAELLQQTELNQRQKEKVDLIHQSADALLTLINDLLDFSRIEAGKLRLCAVPFSLRELCEGVVKLLRPQVAGKPVQVEFVWAAQSEGECVGDAGRVRQVLVNLLGNAVKFTGRGKVELRVMDAGQEMFRVEVSDTGIGIPLEVQPRIFGKFVQADSSSKRQYGGSGLGLAISRQLVEAMGGQIGFRSQPGEGSCFWFEIPVQMEGEAGSTTDVLPKEAKGQIPPGLPVLVAEDNPVNQRLAQRMLENLGCTVQLAANGLEAISLVMNGEFEMIFMDCQMPGMDGFEAAQAIRAMKPEQVIVALTANALPTDRQRCLAAGMQDYLAKPVRQQELQEMLLRWAGS